MDDITQIWSEYVLLENRQVQHILIPFPLAVVGFLFGLLWALDDSDVSPSELIDEHAEVMAALLCWLLHLLLFESSDWRFFIEILLYVVCLGMVVVYEAADTAFGVFVFVLDVE